MTNNQNSIFDAEAFISLPLSVRVNAIYSLLTYELMPLQKSDFARFFALAHPMRHLEILCNELNGFPLDYVSGNDNEVIVSGNVINSENAELSTYP